MARDVIWLAWLQRQRLLWVWLLFLPSFLWSVYHGFCFAAAVVASGSFFASKVQGRAPGEAAGQHCCLLSSLLIRSLETEHAVHGGRQRRDKQNVTIFKGRWPNTKARKYAVRYCSCCSCWTEKRQQNVLRLHSKATDNSWLGARARAARPCKPSHA